LTVAEIWDVAPSEVRLRLVTERVIEVATGVGVGVDAVGLLSPPQLHNNSENNTAPNSTVLFMPVFCSAPLRPATQDAQNTVYRFWVSDGGKGVLGYRLSEKGTHPSYQIFFGERRFSGVDVYGPAPVLTNGRIVIP
jgi:hypothetical protein